MTVWTIRRVVKIGISAKWLLPFAESSGDTPEKLAARDPLQTLQASVYPAYEGLRQPLPPPHGGDQSHPREQVGDVVLAEVDEGEAEGAGVGPAEGALNLARFGEGQRSGDGGGEVQRGHRRPGVAAERVVHLRP